METLIVVAQHRHHQYHGNKSIHGSTGFCSGSNSSDSFRGINCRTFHSGAGLPSNPFKYCSSKIHVTEKAFCSSLSAKTPLSPLRGNPKMSERYAKTSFIPIPMNINFENNDGGLHFSEFWAGPAYSNSPPPNSLPIPQFSLSPKRTASLDLPNVASEIDLPPFSKYAPAFPRERSPSPTPSNLFDITDSATKTLRRMLNLDIDDE